MDCCKYHSPHGYPLEIKQMVFADAVRHGFEPHDAHETLLDACGDGFCPPHSAVSYWQGAAPAGRTEVGR